MRVKTPHPKIPKKRYLGACLLAFCALFAGSYAHATYDQANSSAEPVADYIVTLDRADATPLTLTPTLQHFEQRAAEHGATVKRTFPAFGMAEVAATASQSLALAALPGVADIHKERIFVDQLDESIAMAHLNTLHAANVTGNNQIIAVLDSGIDTSHPFFANRVVAEACFSDDSAGHTSLCPNGTAQQVGPGSACNDSLYSCDHGTHVSGIALGANSGLNGAAPDAQLVAIQVSTIRQINNGSGSHEVTQANEGTLLAAMQWLAQQNYSNLAAINISQAVEEGRSTIEETGFCDNDNGLAAAIASFRQNGTATTVASGNYGYRGAVNYPACISHAITVARTTNTGGSWDENSSNLGPQVDLFAPGEDVYSAITGGNYGNKTGTSMAAPHVAGTFALLRGAFPAASVDTIETALKTTGSPYFQEGADQTFPELDAVAAYLALAGTPAPTYEAENGSITAGAVESNHTGFSGTGFVNLDNVGGSSVTIAVNVAEAGDYHIKVRYANGYSARYADLQVNGTFTEELTFYPIGDWSMWAAQEATAYLNAGSNTITIYASAAPGAANIDSITLVPASLGNQAPNVANPISDLSLDQGESGSIDLSGVFADADGDTLSYSLSGANSAVSASISGATLYYSADQAGSATLSVTASDGIASANNSFTITVNGTSGTLLEAEDHTYSSGTTVDTDNAGFTGTGFVNTPNTAGQWVAFSTTINTSGTYTVGVRYANGSSTNRAASVEVDGVNAVNNVDFNGTGSWATWQETTFDIQLSAGTHTIRLNMLTSSGGANIDSYSVNLSGTQPGAVPVATYSFDGNYNDSTGNFGAGTPTGATVGTNGNNVAYSSGISSQSLYLLGGGLQLPNNLITSNEYSISLWLNPDQLSQFTTAFFGYTSDSNWISVVPRGTSQASENSMVWSGTAWYDASMGQQIPTGVWSHVVMVNNGGDITLYLDGQAVFTGTGFPDVFSAGTTLFAVGVNYWDTPFQGRIDELNIFDEAITASDVSTLYSL